MRSLLTQQIAALAGAELARHMTGWPWLCLSCAHVHLAEDVDSPRAVRALATHKLACSHGRALPGYGVPCTSFLPARMMQRARDAQARKPVRLPFLCRYCVHASQLHALELGKLYCTHGLEHSAYGRSCPGFTRARKTVSNEKHTQATNGLLSSADCCTMEAPKNTTRRHKGLSDFPRAGRTLVTAFADFTCRAIGQVFSHIGQVCNVRGPARARRSRSGRGALQACPFLFPKHYEVFNV